MRRPRLLYLMAIAFVCPLALPKVAKPQSVIGSVSRIPVTEIKSNDTLSAAAEAVALVISTFPSGSVASVLDTSETGSGVLVAPCLVLTARHVLGSQSLEADIGRSITVSLFRRGSGKSIAQVQLAATIRVAGNGFGRWTNTSVDDDWVLLELSSVVDDIVPIELAQGNCCNPSKSSRAALVGFPVDEYVASRPIPWIDPDCRITERLANQMLVTNCIATSGNSGGPLLNESGSGWRLAGLLTRAAPPDMTGRATMSENFAIPIGPAIRRQIQRTQLSSKCPPSTPVQAMAPIAPPSQSRPRQLPDSQYPKKRLIVPWFRGTLQPPAQPQKDPGNEPQGPTIAPSSSDGKPPAPRQ